MSRAARATLGVVARPVSARAGSTEGLLSDIRALIESARTRAAQATNVALVLLYWSIGNHIRRDVLHEQRAGYGERIVATLSRQLTAEYGSGFGRRNLFNMLRFAEVFLSAEIANSESRIAAGMVVDHVGAAWSRHLERSRSLFGDQRW